MPNALPALSSWNAHYPTRSAGRKKVAERDFITLNKSAVQSGLTTAQEQTQFRATHDIRRRDDSDRKSSQSNSKFPADMVFGISTRQRMHDILLYHFAVSFILVASAAVL